MESGKKILFVIYAVLKRPFSDILFLKFGLVKVVLTICLNKFKLLCNEYNCKILLKFSLPSQSGLTFFFLLVILILQLTEYSTRVFENNILNKLDSKDLSRVLDSEIESYYIYQIVSVHW